MTMTSFTSVLLCLLLALHFGGGEVEVGVEGAPLPLQHQDQTPEEGWEPESERGERCLGVLGSARGAVQGLIGDAAKSRTPAERLQEFRNRVEAVRALVVPPGSRRAPPPTAAGQSSGLPLFGQPSAGAGPPQPLFPLPSSSRAVNSILGQPAPSGAELPILAPIQRTLADVRAALAPSADGAKTYDLPVSPFTKKQVAAALSIPEGIMKNTADILGVTRDDTDSDRQQTEEGILGSAAHADEAAPPPVDVVNAAAVARIDSSNLATGVEQNNENKRVTEASEPYTVIPESLLPYVPRIPRPLNIPGVLERQAR